MPAVLWSTNTSAQRAGRGAGNTRSRRYYEHLADDEIADVLHISASTVRSNAARGLATLRTTLTPTKKV